MATTILNTDGKIKPTGMRRILENRDLFPAVLIVVVGVVSFGLGRLARPAADIAVPFGSMRLTVPMPTVPVVESMEQGDASGQKAGNAPSASGSYVASKNSNKYHLPWCSGATRITEENKIWFSSKAEAEAAGYPPAGNCKGI